MTPAAKRGFRCSLLSQAEVTIKTEFLMFDTSEAQGKTRNIPLTSLRPGEIHARVFY
jgi:hypothetical protein